VIGAPVCDVIVGLKMPSLDVNDEADGLERIGKILKKLFGKSARGWRCIQAELSEACRAVWPRPG
jgi:hypothetical protein